MLPLFLSIEGLYSYQEKQVIDFTTLTEAGLFGIFGNVGSGKSSILEAISYALYGETERLNKQEKRAYNMLNLKSDQAIIDFQFLNFENRKFRFVVQWKRRKKFEDTTSIERTAYEWLDNSWIPLESADGALVTNLSYPNFRRTIIIPQGQFKEFLELKGKDRSDMMKEIFFLNQYDLGPKVSYLQADNNKKLENIKGALTGFEEVSDEIKLQKETELKIAKEMLFSKKQEVENLTQEYKKLSQAFEHRKDLEAKEQEMNVLNQKRSQIQLFEKELSEYEIVSLHFREHINNLQNTNTIKEQLLSKIEKLQEGKTSLAQQINSTQQQLDRIQEDYNNLDIYKKQVSEFQLLILNTDLNQNKIELLNRIEKGTPILLETKEKEKSLLRQLQEEETNIEQLKAKRINTSDLLALESWYQQWDQLIHQEADIRERVLNMTKEIDSLKEVFKTNNLLEETWEKTIDSRWTEIQAERQQLQDQEANIRVKQELSQYILELHDGAACPLCGSLDHPNKMHTDDLSSEIHSLNELKINISNREIALRQLQNTLNTTTQILKDKRLSTEKLAKEIELNSIEKGQHEAKFQWPEFNKNDRKEFEEQKSKVKQLEDIIELKNNTIKQLRINIDNTRENILKYEKSIDTFKNQVLIIESNIAQNLDQVIHLQNLNSSNLTKMELSMQCNKLDKKIKIIEKSYQEWTEQLIKQRNELATILGQLGEAQEQYKTYNTQLQSIQTTIYALLKTFNYADIAEVIFILNKTIDTAAMKDSIQQFHLKFNALNERVQELRKTTEMDGFSQSLFEEISITLKEKSSELEDQISLTGSLEKELQRIIIELDKKINLIKEFDALNSRKENLKILDNMFKGNGFVNYVSSIHLERLCEIANQRFHRLTKNQLSLCVNESNEFEVKDYLNNGYQRSVKTLSGGQSFQASLCLALALAENIQALNKADRNFFFIDEGFGTQDNESINTVFDTLQYLHQENRIVGIISHVEELKERMPRSITIQKDLEKGSQIKY